MDTFATSSLPSFISLDSVRSKGFLACFAKAERCQAMCEDAGECAKKIRICSIFSWSLWSIHFRSFFSRIILRIWAKALPSSIKLKLLPQGMFLGEPLFSEKVSLGLGKASGYVKSFQARLQEKHTLDQQKDCMNPDDCRMQGGRDGSCSREMCHTLLPQELRPPSWSIHPAGCQTQTLQGWVANLQISHVVTSGSVLFGRAWSIQKRMVGIKKDRWGWSTCTEVPTTYSVRCKEKAISPTHLLRRRSQCRWGRKFQNWTLFLSCPLLSPPLPPSLSSLSSPSSPSSSSSSSSSSSLLTWVADLTDRLTDSLPPSLAHCQNIISNTSAASNSWLETKAAPHATGS